MLPLAFLDGVDPWIFAFSFITVVVTIGMGFWSAKQSKTASDFLKSYATAWPTSPELAT